MPDSMPPTSSQDDWKNLGTTYVSVTGKTMRPKRQVDPLGHLTPSFWEKAVDDFLRHVDEGGPIHMRPETVAVFERSGPFLDHLVGELKARMLTLVDTIVARDWGSQLRAGRMPDVVLIRCGGSERIVEKSKVPAIAAKELEAMNSNAIFRTLSGSGSGAFFIALCHCASCGSRVQMKAWPNSCLLKNQTGPQMMFTNVPPMSIKGDTLFHPKILKADLLGLCYGCHYTCTECERPGYTPDGLTVEKLVSMRETGVCLPCAKDSMSAFKPEARNARMLVGMRQRFGKLQ
jgi:hypothetical protein